MIYIRCGVWFYITLSDTWSPSLENIYHLLRLECPHFFLYTTEPLVIPEQTLINGQNLCDIYTTKIKYQQSIWKYYGNKLFLGQTQDQYSFVLTCLSELGHLGEVVHVAVAQEGIAGKVEVGGLQGGVGGEGGQVQGDKGVAIQSTTEQQSTNRTSLSSAFFENLSLIT